MAVCLVVIALAWVNLRVFVLRTQADGKIVVLSGYYVYHGMAEALSEGRVGQVDMAALRQFLALHDSLAVYKPVPPGGNHEWVNYYTLDIGYLFIVELARLAFPTLPDNVLRSLALQLVADAAVVGFVYFLFSHWNVVLGILASFLYVTNFVFASLVSFAYYYYWDIPLTLVVLGTLTLAWHRPLEARRWLTLAGIALGCGVWLRGSWWPLSLFFFALAATTPLRARLMLPLVMFGVVAAPQVIRSSVARGQLALSTRTVWHVAMVGLGYYPNPYGLEAKDESVFKLTHDKYGINFRAEDFELHDQAAKKEFLSIWRNDRGFIVRSFLGRLKESLLGSTQTRTPSYLFVPNVAYRLLCLVGLAAMIIRGGEKRLLAIAAGGMYAIYVVLTCLFYFVGLAYDNVTEVTMFVCLMGGIEACAHWTGGRLRRPAIA